MWIALLPWILLAQPPSTALLQAEAAYQEQRFEQILPLLEQALAEALGPEERVRVYALKARTHAAFGERESAIGAYLKVLSLEPTYAPGSDASPKLRALFAEARARAGPPLAVAPAPPPSAWRPSAPAARAALPAAEKAWYRQGWVWGLVGGAALATGASVYLLTREPVPTGNLPSGTLQP